MSDIPITIDLNSNDPIAKPASNFIYVDQGNYQSVELVEGESFTIYSDSATSCIITIVMANKGEQHIATLAHLDSPDCIEAFFDIIAAQGADSYQIVAQGANPPDNDTAQANADQIQTSIDALANVTQSDLYLKEGNPNEGNRGDFGLIYSGGKGATATNQPYSLELYDRDPTCGGQTVYCIMRRQENPPVQIRDASQPFTYPELVELVAIAVDYQTDPDDPKTAFTNAVNLQGEDVRQLWSSTPDDEAPWFSDQLKMGSAFAVAMSSIVELSADHLLETHGAKYGALREALLGKKS